MRGGKRQGAGRPKEDPKTVIRVRLTQEQHANYLERGADIWLKRVLEIPAKRPATAQMLDDMSENCGN